MEHRIPFSQSQIAHEPEEVSPFQGHQLPSLYVVRKALIFAFNML